MMMMMITRIKKYTKNKIVHAVHRERKEITHGEITKPFLVKEIK